MARKYKYPKQLDTLHCQVCGVELKYSSRVAHLNALTKQTKFCRSCTQKQYVHKKHSEEHKEYMRNLMTGRKISWSEKIANSHWSKDPNKRKDITERHSNYMGDLISSGKLCPSNNKSFMCGHYLRTSGESEYYRSSYELRRMIELDQDPSVVNWTTKHGIRISYVQDDVTHNYIPDFYIEYSNGKIVIEEVKGWISDHKKHQCKVESAITWCRLNNYDYIVNFMR